MTEKRFELKVNQHNRCDIVDWVESKEKNVICIYNDLGDYYFSSAKALCELLNELNEENNALKSDRYRFEEEARLFALSELDKVFALIDKKIREYSNLEQRERTSNDTIEVLKELKKELEDEL